MSGDKRSVSTDALETLGTIIDENAGRDAIHVAVEPVQAATGLMPGERVGLKDGKASRDAAELIGIVDPFLAVNVRPGDWFWLLMYPRTITSLRHVWSHPAFEDKEPVAIPAPAKARSEAWLREFCESAVDSELYDDIMSAIANGGEFLREDGYSGASIWDDYLTVRGRDALGEIPPKFWDHVEIVTGKKITNRASHFSCSC